MRQRLVCSDRAGGRRWVVLLGVMIGVVAAPCVGASAAVASTTSVFYDDNSNLAADPVPFGGGAPTGVDNTAVGRFTLGHLTSGEENTAVGFAALYENTTGSDNVASGGNALYRNTAGNSNVAAGKYALNENTSGSANVATGQQSLGLNTTGNDNVAYGSAALESSETVSGAPRSAPRR
jgi:hypothetical protein